MFLVNCRYNYGTQRYNYVSTDKRFKTTIFGNNKSEMTNLFTTIFKVIGETFDERNLSVTLDRNRLNNIKRSKSLGEIKVNQTNYNKHFKMGFKKAVLLVNGLNQPIPLS